ATATPRTVPTIRTWTSGGIRRTPRALSRAATARRTRAYEGASALMSRPLRRREFLARTGAALLGGALAGCSFGGPGRRVAGARVTIYAKELPPNVRSSLATGLWTPDSRICFEQYATPEFRQLWERMARRSFATYQTLLGLPGAPVEFIDVYFVADSANGAR